MTYNNNGVLIGNWCEERLKTEYELKIFLRKRERQELLLQKSRTLFSNLLKERPLAISGLYVLFGYNVQIVASDMPAKPKTADGKTEYGLALSSLVSERQVDSMQNICDGCLMTLSPITTPCCRNTFVILSAEDESIHGQKMKYGDEFFLRGENYAEPNVSRLFTSTFTSHESTSASQKETTVEKKRRKKLNSGTSICAIYPGGYSGAGRPNAYPPQYYQRHQLSLDNHAVASQRPS